MTFSEFLEEVKKVKREEQRAEEAEYLEIVISREVLASLHAVLSSYFGPPLKPEGDSPSGEANRHAKPYGGIRKDQTMYFRRDGAVSECALLWPWGSGGRITVKIIQSRNADSPPESGLSSFFGRLTGRK
jgi:hypothetical protein